MTDCRTSTSIDWLERARKLEPMIQTYRDEAEQSRRMPRPLFEALRDAGFFQLWVPRRLGGPEVDMTTLILVVEELSRLEGATGWNVMIGAEGSGLAAYLPEETARELIAPPRAVVAGSFQPKGEATPVEGGYRVSGVCPLASGCAHATVVAGACRIVGRGRARTGPDDTRDLQVVLIPASQCEVIDTWYSAGLRGTGSSDFKVKDAFVPDNRCFSLAQGVASEPGALYGATIQVLFALPVAAVGLGIARAAIDAFTGVAAGKVRLGGSAALAQDGLVQATVGRAEAQLRSARAFVLTVAEEMTRSTVSEGQVSHETSTLVPLAAAHACETATEVVTMIFRVAGSSAIYAGSRLERCFRDVHMVTQHRSTNIFNFETAGRQLLAGVGDD
jgi:alkylation response protein AidB-like acyl-CoA dehydrogenase